MSGRSRYSKSAHPLLGRVAVHRATRHAASEMPDWRARFIIPDRIGFAVALGGVRGVIGAEITRIGRFLIAEITGKNRTWVLSQADRLADTLGHLHRPLYVMLARDPQPAFALSSPFGRGDDHVVEIMHGGKIVAGDAMRTIVTGK